MRKYTFVIAVVVISIAAIVTAFAASTNLSAIYGRSQSLPGKFGFDGTNYTQGVTPFDENGNPIPVPSGDPCQTVAKSTVPISQTASTKLITGTSSKKTYICSIAVNGGDSETLSIVEGTGTVCATGAAAMIGSTTAANGMVFAPNGGFAHGNGGYTIAAGQTNANDVCLFQNGVGRVAGVIGYVQK